ncbi:S26 family signal peptidase [Prescottella equi]
MIRSEDEFDRINKLQLMLVLGLILTPSVIPRAKFFGPVTVPEGNVWVMGDNRANSKDLRFHLDDELQGTVPVSDIIGKVRFIVLPPSRWGVVHAVDPQQ